VGNHPMGVLDHYRIPKKVYYTFQSNWNAGVTDDYPAAGLSAAKVHLEADVTTLLADSTDLSRVIGSIRDATGRCVWSSAPISFQVTGPADVFEGSPVTRNAIAGKIGIILKSKQTPGTVTVNATSEGLEPATLTLTVKSPDVTSLPFVWPTGGSVVPSAMVSSFNRQPVVRHLQKMIIVTFSAPLSGRERVSLIPMRGERLVPPVQCCGTKLKIATEGVASGCYRLRIKNGTGNVEKTIVLAR